MAKFKKNQAEKQGLETPPNCDVMSHAKKETYNNSGLKRDFGFIFFCIRNATPHRLCPLKDGKIQEKSSLETKLRNTSEL